MHLAKRNGIIVKLDRVEIHWIPRLAINRFSRWNSIIIRIGPRISKVSKASATIVYASIPLIVMRREARRHAKFTIRRLATAIDLRPIDRYWQ